MLRGQEHNAPTRGGYHGTVGLGCTWPKAVWLQARGSCRRRRPGAIASVASAGGAGVDLVILSILSSLSQPTRKTHEVSGAKRRSDLDSIQIPRHFDVVNGSITCAKFKSMYWIAVLPYLLVYWSISFPLIPPSFLSKLLSIGP